MFRLAFSRVATLFGAILFWTWFAVKLAFDWIGRTTVLDDYNQMVDRLPGILHWLYGTPWYVPAILASLLTVALLWAAVQGYGANRPAAQLIRKKKASAGKRQILEEVRGKYFSKERVLVDGKHFIGCRFAQVTFVYNGTNIFKIEHSHIWPPLRIHTESQEITALLELLFELDFLKIDYRRQDGMLASRTTIFVGDQPSNVSVAVQPQLLPSTESKKQP